MDLREETLRRWRWSAGFAIAMLSASHAAGAPQGYERAAFAGPHPAQQAQSDEEEQAPYTRLAQSSRRTTRGAEDQASPRSGIPGRYALLRENDRDSGCLVTLRPNGRAQLGPGCRDQGLVVFDPVAWSAGRGTIVLRARKGHRITFVHKPDGIWVREPADKRPLALRKY